MISERGRILAVGLAHPPRRYSQREILELFGIHDPRRSRFFEHEHVRHRYLVLPEDGHLESTGELREKHRLQSVELGRRAVEACLRNAGLNAADVDYLCVVTSTGFLVPGLSVWLAEACGFRAEIQRADLVGMGCHGGLNGLNAASAWSIANPGSNALLICSEICSAIYSLDDSAETSLANSLFGDGVAAALVRSEGGGPALLGFGSFLIPDSKDALRFDWDDEAHRYRFHIDRATPSLLARESAEPVKEFLKRHSLRIEDVRHWGVHTGGSAILDGIERSLGLGAEALAVTRSILREYGNLSSGSFLFVFERIVRLRHPRPGDVGILMTMGPGLTLELALARW